MKMTVSFILLGLFLAGCASKESVPVCSAENQAKITDWDMRFQAVLDSSEHKKAAKIWKDLQDKKISEKTANKKSAPYMKIAGPKLIALRDEKKALLASHPECNQIWKKHDREEAGFTVKK